MKWPTKKNTAHVFVNQDAVVVFASEHSVWRLSYCRHSCGCDFCGNSRLQKYFYRTV